jgi:hypothetical protein
MMQRRGFLKIAGRLGAGIGVAGPLLGPLAGVAQADADTGGTQPRELIMALDEGWSIGIDPDNVGREQSWFQGARLDAKATPVPSIIQELYPAYHGVVWYWLDFKASSNPLTNGRSLLRFHAVDYLADVWFNGHHVGSHEGGETPFVLDVTDVVRPNQSNKLAVRVLNPDNRRIDGIVLAETPHRNKVVKFSNGSLYDFGGILQPVELVFVPAARISNLHIIPDWKTGDIAIRLTIQNALSKSVDAAFRLLVSQDAGQTVLQDTLKTPITAGESQVSHQITLKKFKLWDLETPNLYQLQVTLDSDGMDGSFAIADGFGFRDFRLVNGYFRLNGRRLFLRCTHTGNHVPFGQVIPPEGYEDMLRRDLLYAKASGFNTVRFISGVAYPYQLDLCDELGLMVYQESSASWLLKDSPRMKTLYENSIREMIVRDRNHASLVMWGMLNETEDGAVSHEGQAALPLVRTLDDTRLVLYSSGRFDGRLNTGSASNPKTSEWEYVWGKESPGAGHVAMVSPSGPGVGDFHLYPKVPQTPETNHMMRTLGEGGRPVFLSEYGIGSMMNVLHELHMYEQAGIPENAEDLILVRSMAEHLVADWARFGMDTAYPYPETLLEMSQKMMGRHRLLGFNLIRSNPMICGFNLTGMLDHALTGEGIWRFWRDWKPGLFDVMQDGWAPVRWCLFAEPAHNYLGRPVTLEAVLANEDAVRPGEYSAQFRVWGPQGTAWKKQAVISIPDNKGKDGPLAVPVMKESVTLQDVAGSYELVPYIEKGIAPPETSWQFYLSDPATIPKLNQQVITWGIPKSVEDWLQSRGANVVPIASAAPEKRYVILIGDVSKEQASSKTWRTLAELTITGSTTLFLSPKAFARADQSSARLPLAKKGRIYEFNDWLYHKECVGKPHPVFDGLQHRGILDWYYWAPVLPTYLFDGQDTPDEVMAAAFAAGYSTPGGYASGVLLGSYNFGAGHFVLNSFHILEHIDVHPAADRLLLNLIQHFGQLSTGPAGALPPDFEAHLKEIGYVD